MTPTNIVALVSVLLSSATVLLVGYWHRKQLRQLEAFRNDPRVGLQPPPSAALKIWVRYSNILLGLWFPLGTVVVLLAFWPLTRTSALLVSANAASIIFYLYSRIELRFSTLLLRHAETELRQAETTLRVVETLEKVVETLKTSAALGSAEVKSVASLAGLLATLQQRVGAVESPTAEASEE